MKGPFSGSMLVVSGLYQPDPLLEDLDFFQGSVHGSQRSRFSSGTTSYPLLVRSEY